MHEQLYLAVSHIYGRRFRCLNMVKMSDVNNFDLKDTDLASLTCFKSCVTLYIPTIDLSTARPKWRPDGHALSGDLLYSLVNPTCANN